MSNQLEDPTAILGFRPDAAEDPAPVKEPQPEDPDTDESGDVDPDQDDMSASDVLDTSDLEDDPDEGEGDDEDTPAGDQPVPGMEQIQAQIDKLSKKSEDTENARREWQSKANQAEADLGKALDLIQQLTSGNGNAQDRQPSVMDRLSQMPDTEVVDAGTVKSLVAELQKSTADQKQSEQYNSLLRQIDSAVDSKQDAQEVRNFFQEQGLGNLPDAKLNNKVGNYWMGRALLLEKKLKEAEGKKNPAEPPKRTKPGTNKDRKKRLDDIPPVSGGRGARPTTQEDPSGIVDTLLKRRAARGIMEGGRIR